MKILVTGANGFMGRNLVASLENIRDGKDRTHPDLSSEEHFCRSGTDLELIRVIVLTNSLVADEVASDTGRACDDDLIA